MKIRQVDTTDADQKSAVAMFELLNAMYDLKDRVALDAFARNGQLTVRNYADYVAFVDCWELSPEHFAGLQSIANVGEIRIGCSYHTAAFENLVSGGSYDMIVVDTPQGLHKAKDGSLKVEHFNFLKECVPTLINDDGLIVLYVNKRPYNAAVNGNHGYDQYEEYDFNKWMAARHDFYGSIQITEEDALAAYRFHLGEVGLEVQQALMVPCFSDVPDYPDYAFRLALSVKKV